jgi:GAF domain-containing protein
MNKIEYLYYPNLYEAAAALTSAHSPKEIFRDLVEMVIKTLAAKGCSLMLLSPDKKQLFHIISCGLSDQYIKKGPVSADKSISETLEGKTISIFKAPDDNRIQYCQQAKQEGISSILSVPLRLRDQILGVMRVYMAEPHRFSNDEKYFVNAVANLSAIAFENAQVYKSVQKNNEKLKHNLEEWRQVVEMERPLWTF